MSKPGRCAVARVASVSVGLDVFHSDKAHLHENIPTAIPVTGLFRVISMTTELANKIVAWAAETANCAAALPSSQARDAYFAGRRRELLAGAIAEGTSEPDAAALAGACIDAAQAITIELLAQRAGAPKGRA
jgi:hypothetical protein